MKEPKYRSDIHVFHYKDRVVSNSYFAG